MEININGRLYSLCSSCQHMECRFGRNGICQKCEQEAKRIVRFLNGERLSRYGNRIVWKKPEDSWYRRNVKTEKQIFESKWESLCGKDKRKSKQ